MIKFVGSLSDRCRNDHAKKIAKNTGILFAILTIIVSIISISVGIINGTWIYAIVLISAFVILTIIAFVPTKRLLHLKINLRIIVNEDVISKQVDKFTISKPLSKVRKVVDMGEYYYVFFKFGDIRNAWVCQKDLLEQGTLEEFELMFQSRLVKK